MLLGVLTLALARIAGCGTGVDGPSRAAAAARSCTIPLLQRALNGGIFSSAWCEECSPAAANVCGASWCSLRGPASRSCLQIKGCLRMRGGGRCLYQVLGVDPTARCTPVPWSGCWLDSHPPFGIVQILFRALGVLYRSTV